MVDGSPVECCHSADTAFTRCPSLAPALSLITALPCLPLINAAHLDLPDACGLCETPCSLLPPKCSWHTIVIIPLLICLLWGSQQWLWHFH